MLALIGQIRAKNKVKVNKTYIVQKVALKQKKNKAWTKHYSNKLQKSHNLAKRHNLASENWQNVCLEEFWKNIKMLKVSQHGQVFKKVNFLIPET